MYVYVYYIQEQPVASKRASERASRQTEQAVGGGEENFLN